MGNLVWRYPPASAGLPSSLKGASPSLDSIAIHKDCLFFRYGRPPGLVSASFSNGTRLDVYVCEDLYVHAVIYDKRGRAANSRPAAMAAGIPRVSILPQIGPLPDGEKRLNDEYVRRNLQTTLSSIHFRNQLRILREEHFDNFRSLVSSTWSGLNIESLDVPPQMDKDGNLMLIVRDGDFSAEVAWMGQGLQMWLQTMWFLCRNKQSDVLILDEPDVYMHADLQRKLVRMLIHDSRQFIIATHSPEMLAEVEPDSVVILNRANRNSKPATSSQAVQKLLIHVGSVHNLSLARLAIHRRILFVEGDDVPILKRFQNVVEPASERLIDTIPNTDIEGWSGWPAVLTFARFLRENANDEFAVYCVLDRDYHTDGEVEERLKQAKSAGVKLHIWSSKELENYAVHPSTIARMLSKKTKNEITSEEVREAIAELVNKRKEETFDAFSETIRQQNRSGADKSNAAARPIFNARWKQSDGWLVVSGKQLMSDLSTWSQAKHKVSLSISGVIREMKPEEVSDEVVEFLTLVTS